VRPDSCHEGALAIGFFELLAEVCCEYGQVIIVVASYDSVREDAVKTRDV
jgi:hypothetical protein